MSGDPRQSCPAAWRRSGAGLGRPTPERPVPEHNTRNESDRSPARPLALPHCLAVRAQERHTWSGPLTKWLALRLRRSPLPLLPASESCAPPHQEWPSLSHDPPQFSPGSRPRRHRPHASPGRAVLLGHAPDASHPLHPRVWRLHGFKVVWIQTHTVRSLREEGEGEKEIYLYVLHDGRRRRAPVRRPLCAGAARTPVVRGPRRRSPRPPRPPTPPAAAPAGTRTPVPTPPRRPAVHPGSRRAPALPASAPAPAPRAPAASRRPPGPRSFPLARFEPADRGAAPQGRPCAAPPAAVRSPSASSS